LTRSRPFAQLISCGALTLGLACGAVTAAAPAQARSIPTRSLAVSWGFDAYGQLGQGLVSGSASSVYGGVVGLSGVTQVAAGVVHSLALTSDGSVWAWGANDDGQLGNDSTASSDVPLQVPGLTGVTQIAAGGEFSLALTSSGSVWAWGRNDEGELGDGSTADSAVPVPVAGLTGVTQIAAGASFGLARRSDGTVWAWGSNGYGQLGSGTTANAVTPTQVTGLSQVTQIAAGGDFAMAARTSGFITRLTSVWTWGDNGNGQLGDGTLASRSTPEQVSGISVPNVLQICAGSNFSLVLGSDGSVWGWGGDYDGQLGNAATFAWTRPVETIGMASGITQLAAGFAHVLALRSDGTVLAWGQDPWGELGNGTTSDGATLPTEVLGLNNVTHVSAGDDDSLAVHNVSVFIFPTQGPGSGRAHS
jgi:alpha-tubulin suppressor-like RCC1 family protein